MPFPAFFLPIFGKKVEHLACFCNSKTAAKPQQNRSKTAAKPQDMATIKLYLDTRENTGDGTERGRKRTCCWSWTNSRGK